MRQPAEDEAVAERMRAEAAEAERARLASEITDLKAWKKEQEDAKEAATKRRAALIGKARHGGGYVSAVLAVVAVVILGFTDVIEGKVGWATASVMLVLVVAASWAWGTSRPLRATVVKALVGVGAVTALWFAVWGIVPDATPAGKSKPAVVVPHH